MTTGAVGSVDGLAGQGWTDGSRTHRRRRRRRRRMALGAAGVVLASMVALVALLLSAVSHERATPATPVPHLLSGQGTVMPLLTSAFFLHSTTTPEVSVTDVAA